MQLVATDLAFAYPGRPVLGGLDLRVSDGVRLGVVGENGSGKTTLLHLLAGRLAPAAGEVRRSGGVALVEQELDAAEEATVGDLVRATLAGLRALAAELERAAARFDHDSGDLAELSGILARAEHLAVWDADRRVDVALTRLGAVRDPARRLDTLSVGQRYRVRLACRLAERADLLLLDEPTNHLDDAAIEFLTGELVAWHGGVVIVTHDRELLDDVATAILDLDPSMDGRPVLYGQPGYLAYRFAKNQALHRWRQRYRAEQQRARVLAERLDASYEGLSDEWRPPKGSQKHRRATRARIHVKAADRLVQKLEAEAVEVPVPPLELAFPDLPAMSPGWNPAHPLVEVRSPRVLADDGGTRLDLPGTRVAVPPSGRLLVVGPNGAGKSTFLAALAGRVRLDRGVRSVVAGARLGVVAQEYRRPEPAVVGDGEEGEEGPPSAFDAYAAEALALLDRGELDPDHVVPVAALGLLSEGDLERPLAELSAGQRRRFELARALLHAPHLLVLDEPTNHLSVDLVDALTRALVVTPAAVVVATHDRRMRADLADWPVLDLS
ncbi:ATP-binding cassette domain-containing protein [Isoptericola sp. NEAU-Y5]|uniref:ATP-binding cassette domain-containing protein n=1 Tax=Isoptericola luteus TaxID=2879484 RepID=A0ABS7ZEA6_9MICO|nr:ATP-binding cassette domain-containing protein [Isoptericola sp. NEAU-Y5]MCA5893369.1 ATP-binding cassette domain-containing protein [Isoptericola sp. NEAU-Y5]